MCYFFFFNEPATTEIYTLSLHDALPILDNIRHNREQFGKMSLENITELQAIGLKQQGYLLLDRKSTRLNSSHANISYAVFCLKKKNTAAARRVLNDHPFPVPCQ